MLLIPRPGFGVAFTLIATDVRYVALGPIPDGVFLGPVSFHIDTADPGVVAYRLGLASSKEASESAITRVISPILQSEPPVPPPASLVWEFGVGGGRGTLVLPWGLRTSVGASWIIVSLTSLVSGNVRGVVVVGAQELIKANEARL